MELTPHVHDDHIASRNTMAILHGISLVTCDQYELLKARWKYTAKKVGVDHVRSVSCLQVAAWPKRYIQISLEIGSAIPAAIVLL